MFERSKGSLLRWNNVKMLDFSLHLRDCCITKRNMCAMWLMCTFFLNWYSQSLISTLHVYIFFIVHRTLQPLSKHVPCALDFISAHFVSLSHGVFTYTYKKCNIVERFCSFFRKQLLSSMFICRSVMPCAKHITLVLGSKLSPWTV